MQAIETERSPGLPSLMVTTRRRLMPHGTSCSFLQAVTQALHSMQRSASQRNFIRAMVASLCRPDLTQGDFRLLHPGRGIVAVAGDRVGAFAEHDRVGAGRIVLAQVFAAEPAAEVERHPGDALPDPPRPPPSPPPAPPPCRSRSRGPSPGRLLCRRAPPRPQD